MKDDSEQFDMIEPLVEKPWGSFQMLLSGKGIQFKTISVNPKSALSLQSHKYRSEFWIITKGQATVIVDGETRILGIHSSIEIPMGSIHRLQNDSDEALEVVELGWGNYLGEDDIIRLEDRYGRV